MIPRSQSKVPKPVSNPAAGVIADLLGHHGLSNAAAARAMKVPRSRLSDLFAGRKGVSADTALRVERLLGFPAEALLRLQAKHDFQKAYHAKHRGIAKEVRPLASGK